MNPFHVPRGFSVTSTIAIRSSPLPNLAILTLRLLFDPLPLQPLWAILFGHQPGHVSPSWSLAFGLLPVDCLLIRFLSRVTLSIHHALISHATSERT